MKELPYEVLIHKSKHVQAEEWCRKCFGPRWSITENRTGTWSCFWAGRDQPDRFRYYFADDRDMILFSLRWSS